ncbi:alpha/beta fold hydrolase [Nesterenkonia muleiensis]|uniref:alpha/beta fold hydrolase n=1 Tax=Nesterenkonia muleiensis TaxID=2282648 RepID=UPI000E73CBF2|nr:alpha/beta hydrolase [Nesterenkonia muleiensis]
MAWERTESFTHGGRQMVYSRLDGPDGLTFVVIHGIGMGRQVYADLCRELARSGTVYAVDLPGFGDSPEPSEPLTMPATGDFLADFIRSLNIENPVLIGHSMGGQVVAETLARHPELSDRGVLIAPAVNYAERTAPRQALRMVQDLAGENPKVMVLGTVQYLKAGPRWFLRKMRQMLEHELEETCPEIRADVLVMRGEKDRVCPRPWIQEIAELLPSSQMEEIPGRGHEAVIRTPQPAADMILAHAEATR